MTLLFATGIGPTAGAQDDRPHWMWASGNAVSFQVTKNFEVDTPTVAAQIRFAPMSAVVQVAVDDRVVATADPDGRIQTVELPRSMDPGVHQISIRAEGVQGPSAVFIELELKYADGRRETIVSDASWSAAEHELNDLGPIDRRLVIHPDRRVGTDVVDNYEQWKQAIDAKQGTDPATFSIVDGFQIQLVHSAKEDEGSWVSMAIDPERRIVIAKEGVGLLRMTLSEDGDSVTDVQRMDETLEECRGLAFIGNDLYVNANNSKGLYRLRDAELGYEKPELLMSTSGYVGHGRNDLVVDSSGMLYSIHGDSVDYPTDASVDFTSPFRNVTQGKREGDGHLLRFDPRSGEVTVLVGGMRNPYGIDFNRDGEAFTYDADAEYDMGSPWYRPTRVSHLTIGSDYGWREVTKSWPPYYPDHPDNTPANLDIGKGSPTAVKFGTRSDFPSPFQDSLFILDWAYGRILAVNMVPCGASYMMTAETFLKGRPLNVTDLEFASDGSMYFVTGGRKTKSALYRVQYVGEVSPEVKPTAFQKSVDRFATHSRRLRRELEAELGKEVSGKKLLRAWKLLGAHDPWIRRAAANVIEHQPITNWSDRALQETDPRKAVVALTSLARSGRSEYYPKIAGRLNEQLAKIQRPSERLHAYYAYWLCFGGDSPVADEAIIAETRSLLNPQYPADGELGPSYPHNRLLSELLVLLDAPDVVTKTIRLMNSVSDQTQQMHYLHVLRNVREGWTLDERRDFFASLRQTSFYHGGAGMPDFVRQIREDAIATLSDELKDELGSLIEAKAEAEETLEVEPREFVRKWTVNEVLSGPVTQPGEQTAKRDKSRGAKVFAQASCIQCHRFGSRGTLIGPDLTAAHRRFSPRDMLSSILEPSKVVSETYRSLRVITTDGQTLTGQATTAGDFRTPILRIATDPNKPSETVEIPKEEIESQKWSEVSWMPEGLMDSFTQDEILDLLDYLESN